MLDMERDMINCKICGKWQNVSAVMRNDLCQECKIKHDEMSGEDMEISRIDIVSQNGPTGAHYEKLLSDAKGFFVNIGEDGLPAMKPGKVKTELPQTNWKCRKHDFTYSSKEYDQCPKCAEDELKRPSYYDMPTTGRLEDLIKDMPHFRGAAFKYMLRAGKKDPATEVEDIKKAIECLQIELGRFE